MKRSGKRDRERGKRAGGMRGGRGGREGEEERERGREGEREKGRRAMLCAHVNKIVSEQWHSTGTAIVDTQSRQHWARRYHAVTSHFVVVTKHWPSELRWRSDRFP